MNANYTITRNNEVLDETVRMLEALNENELRAIKDLIEAFLGRTYVDKDFPNISEEEAFLRIESSLQNAENGIYEDAEKMAEDIIEEFDL